MSRLNVNKITGTTGTESGAPITLSGDTVTLGSGVTLPAGSMVNFTETTTTPTATQGTDTSYTVLTGSSVSYTPATGCSFVVYTYQTCTQQADNTSLAYYEFQIDGTTQTNLSWGAQHTWGDGNSGIGMVWTQIVLPAYTGAKTLRMRYKVHDSGNELRLHYSIYPTAYVKIYRTTYSIM